MTLAKAASNMTTIWHDPDSFSQNNNPTEYNYHRQVTSSPDEVWDRNDEVNSTEPDFSEFIDPWENYTEHVNTDFVISEATYERQTDSDEQYYDSRSQNHNESHPVSYNQCSEVEPSSSSYPSSSSSPSFTSCHDNVQPEDDHHHHSSLHPFQTFQASQQDNFSYENEINQQRLDNHVTVQRLSEQESSTIDQDDVKTETKSLIQNLREINAFCDFLEEMTRDEDHNHHTDQHDNHSAINNNHHIDHALDCRQSSNTISNSNNRDDDRRQTDNPSSSQIQTPCTDPSNVVTQSALSASPCIENANGGLAGALSQMTLGETRTAEQRAIEEHMRKQQWEQGQVDFMGRDSFDNILKKIEETLSSGPGKEPSPPKETGQPKKSSSKGGQMEAAVEGSNVALPGTFKLKDPKPARKDVDAKKTKDKQSSSK